MERLWYTLKKHRLLFTTTLLLVFCCQPVLAAPETQRGMFIIDPHMGGTDAINVATQFGEDAISIALDDWNSITPDILEPYLGHPIWHVYFRTAGGLEGYSWSWIRDHFEGAGWGQLVTSHPEVEWVLTIGNEPSVDLPNMDSWGQRWWMIAVYQELANNAYGHLDQGWRQKYPNLKWGVAVGTDYNSMLVHIQWLPSDGGIRDYYDIIVVHVYGENSLTDNVGGPRSYDVYQYLINDPFTKAVFIGEMGIHAPSRSIDWKVEQYRSWINAQPAKLVGATPFIAGFSDSWPYYSITTYHQGTVLGDHWTP